VNTKYVYKFAILVCLSVIIVIFTNCGKPSTLVFENGSIAVSESTSPSVVAFESTLYPITRANCISCHNPNSNVPVSPLHASDNVSQAHDELIKQAKVDFVTPSNSRIVKKLLLPGGHNCWGDCADNAAEIQAAVTNWAAAVGTTRDPASNPTGTPTGIMTTKTLSVATELAAATNTTVNFTVSGVTYTGKQIQFVINDLIGNPTGGNIFFRVDLYNYDNFSYQLRNPRIVVPAGTAQIPLKRIFVRNIKIAINGTVKPEHPVWTTIERTTAATTTTILSTSAMLASKDKGNAEDMLSFNFQELKVDTRSAAELSKDFFEKTLYVMTRENCSSCHTANQTPLHASLNIQTAHDAAVGIVNFTNPAASRIVTKIRGGHKGIDTVDIPLMMEQAITNWNAGRSQ
jgi:mono/diheme cytochrome c family protein